MAASEPSYREEFLQFRAPSFPLPKADYPPPLRNVVRFLDTHLDEALLLKRVILLPNLASELATMPDDAIAEFPPLDAISDELFVMTDGAYDFLDAVEHGRDTFRIQLDGIARPGTQLGSSRFIIPDQPEQVSVLGWTITPRLSTDYDEKDLHPFLVQNGVLRIRDKEILGSRAKKFRPEVLDRVLDIQRHIPYCCLGFFFSPGAHAYLEEMESLTKVRTFDWERNSRCTGKSPKTCVSVTSDASVSLWTLPAHVTTRDKPSPDVFEYGSAGNIWPTTREDHAPTMRDYIQRVRDDAASIFDGG